MILKSKKMLSNLHEIEFFYFKIEITLDLFKFENRAEGRSK